MTAVNCLIEVFLHKHIVEALLALCNIDLDALRRCDLDLRFPDTDELVSAYSYFDVPALFIERVSTELANQPSLKQAHAWCQHEVMRKLQRHETGFTVPIVSEHGVLQRGPVQPRGARLSRKVRHGVPRLPDRRGDVCARALAKKPVPRCTVSGKRICGRLLSVATLMCILSVCDV